MGKLLHVNWPFMSAGYRWPDNSFHDVFNCKRFSVSVTGRGNWSVASNGGYQSI